MHAVGYGGMAKTSVVPNTTIDISDAVRLKGQLLHIAQVSGPFGDDIDGALGYDVFVRMIVRIDYPNRMLTFTMPGQQPKPAAPQSTVPIKLEDNTPTIKAAIDGRSVGDFLVDSGDAEDLHVYNGYALANKLNGDASSPDTATSTGFGVGGTVKEVITAGHRITINGLTVDGLTVSTIPVDKMSSRCDLAGGIGNGVLAYYAVTFDYADNTMTFEQSTPATRTH
jgi:hypothetical protein